MQRGHRAYLKDILDAIRKIERYTTDHSFKDFANDELVVDGVVRNLEIIGEAVKNLPEEIKAIDTEVEWKKIAGLRDILIHGYFGIDEVLVWDVVMNKVPELKKRVLILYSESRGHHN